MEDNYSKLINSPEFKRNSYVRRMTGILVFPFLIPAMIIAYLMEKFLGVSGYITCSITGFVGITLAVLLAQHKANKKFGERK